MRDIAKELRAGTLAEDFVGLAAELGDPDALAAIERPPTSDPRDWANRARELIEARLPADHAAAEEWETADAVVPARQAFEMRLAIAVCRSLVESCDPPARRPLTDVIDLVRELPLSHWENVPWERTQLTIREIGDIMRQAEAHPGTPVEFTEVIVAIVRDLTFESQADEVPPAIDAAMDRLGPEASRAALRQELAAWLLNPGGAPHKFRALSEEERRPPEPEPDPAPAVAAPSEETLRDRLADLPHEELVRVLIAIAEVELFERALPAEDLMRAEAALDAARAWLLEGTTHRNDEAHRAGENARDLLAGLAAVACARFPHLAARTATEVLAAMPHDELRTMVYTRLAEELQSLGR